MKVVILAGGFGTRISEESHLKPKPMIEIGEFPIITHIMKIYSAQGFNDFIICAGYRQNVIKEYFAHYYLYANDVEFCLGGPRPNEKIVSHQSDNWHVLVSDTGLNTQTGGRLARIKKYVGDEAFLLTYGDGVGDVDLKQLLRAHNDSGKTVTMTVYNFGQAKGVVDIDSNGQVRKFREKSDLDGNLINIGFMVCEPDIFDYIDGDACVLEKGPLVKLAEQGKINAYIHRGFWQCMDTMNERNMLENLWKSGMAPWKVW